MRTSVAIGLLAAAPSLTLAQPNLLYNGGFETANPANPSVPDGWAPFNTALYQPAGPAHSGLASIELASGNNFVAFTTNTFNPTTLQLYDPKIVFQGGAVTARGWYMIPASSPLEGANAGLKFEFRRVPPNFSIYQAYEVLSINGHTNGQWVQFTLKFNCQQFEIHPEPPASVSVLPLRFGGGTGGTGTIYWDDLTVVQCRADFNCSDTLTIADFGAFQASFAAGEMKADMNGDGNLTIADFGAFQGAFAAGCP